MTQTVRVFVRMFYEKTNQMQERFSNRTCDVKSRKGQSALAYRENVFFLLQKLSSEAYTLTPSLLLHEMKKMIMCTFEEIVV